jgi:hypothetical protein
LTIDSKLSILSPRRAINPKFTHTMVKIYP